MWNLEQELRAELQRTRVIRARDPAVVTVAGARVDVLKLRVTEGVVAFRPKLQARPFMRGQMEALVKREIPGEEAKTAHGILARADEAGCRVVGGPG